MSIELHIERLVIDEAVLGSERASSVRAAVQLELAQWLRMPGAADLLRGLGHAATLHPSASVAACSPDGPLAARIATAVGHGLGIPSAATPGNRGMPGDRHV